jgi:Glycosyl transferases group 1/Glycosyltransferase Family 4
MKIALIAPDVELSDALARELGRRGHLVSVHDIAQACDASLPSRVQALHKRLRRERPDVVHGVRWTGGLAALAAVRGLDVPVVASLAVSHRSAADPRRVRLEPAVGRGAAAVLAGTSAEVASLARIGVPRSSVRYVPAGVDTAVFTPDGPIAPRDGASPRLLAFTDLTAAAAERQALRTLTEAMTRVPDAELVVCAPPARAEARAAMLRSADIVVTTCCYEPSGRTTLEAMACGKPVLAPATDGHLDAMVDGTTGLLIVPGNPSALARRIRQLLAHPVMLTAYGVAGADRARSRYGWARIAAETEAVYARVTGQALSQPEASDADPDAVDLAA